MNDRTLHPPESRSPAISLPRVTTPGPHVHHFEHTGEVHHEVTMGMDFTEELWRCACGEQRWWVRP